MHEQLLLEHVRRVGEGRVHVAIADGDDGGDVAREIAVRAGGPWPRRVATVAHRRQRFEIELHRRGGILGQISVGGDRHCDGLADVADLVTRQRELRARRLDRRIGHQHGNLAARHARRQIIGGEHGMDARHGARRRHVDGTDSGVGVWAAHEAGVQRAGKLDVVDETAAPGEQRRVFEARHAGAEMLRPHGSCPRHSTTR
jgi:hypothetical protein